MTRSISSSSAIANFFRNLPETLQQPAALAMIGSLGAHALALATLPAFTSPPEKPADETRQVQIVELPRRQQPTLQQPATSTLPLPPVTQSPTDKAQTTRIPGDETTAVFPPNPLYSIPDLSVPAPPSTPKTDINKLIAEFNAEQAAARQRQRALQAKTPKVRVSPSVSPLPAPSIAPPIAPSVAPSSPATRSPTDGLTPANPTDIARGTTPVPPTTPVQPQASPTTPATTPTSPTPNTAANDQLLAATRYNPERTDPKEVQVKWYGEWLSGLSQRGITDIEPKRVRQADQPIPELPYPLQFALKDFSKQSPAVIAQLVDREGKPIGKPELIGSTGFKVLNDSAIATVEDVVKKTKFEPSDRVRAYIYEYQFKAPTTEKG